MALAFEEVMDGAGNLEMADVAVEEHAIEARVGEADRGAVVNEEGIHGASVEHGKNWR